MYFIWWPPDAVAGLGSLRKLAKTGVPVLKNQSITLMSKKRHSSFGYGRTR
jgi:hypothetical protein